MAAELNKLLQEYRAHGLNQAANAFDALRVGLQVKGFLPASLKPEEAEMQEHLPSRETIEYAAANLTYLWFNSFPLARKRAEVYYRNAFDIRRDKKNPKLLAENWAEVERVTPERFATAPEVGERIQNIGRIMPFYGQLMRGEWYFQQIAGSDAQRFLGFILGARGKDIQGKGNDVGLNYSGEADEMIMSLKESVPAAVRQKEQWAGMPEVTKAYVSGKLSLDPQLSEIPVTPLTETTLDLDPRTRHILESNHITTLEELSTMTRKDLLYLRNLGDKSIKKIHDGLLAIGRPTQIDVKNVFSNDVRRTL